MHSGAGAGGATLAGGSVPTAGCHTGPYPGCTAAGGAMLAGGSETGGMGMFSCCCCCAVCADVSTPAAGGADTGAAPCAGAELVGATAAKLAAEAAAAAVGVVCPLPTMPATSRASAAAAATASAAALLATASASACAAAAAASASVSCLLLCGREADDDSSCWPLPCAGCSLCICDDPATTA